MIQTTFKTDMGKSWKDQINALAYGAAFYLLRRLLCRKSDIRLVMGPSFSSSCTVGYPLLITFKNPIDVPSIWDQLLVTKRRWLVASSFEGPAFRRHLMEVEEVQLHSMVALLMKCTSWRGAKTGVWMSSMDGDFSAVHFSALIRGVNVIPSPLASLWTMRATPRVGM